MSSVVIPPQSAVYYPDSDGKPMAENSLQAQWIVTLFGNLELLFAQRPDVFVAMDNFWYPVEGKPKVCQAPDVYVVFGRPKGRRGSYKQWEEGGIAPQVVFEVLSPGNRFEEMLKKFRFYQKHGVEEYYILNPDSHKLEVWFRVEQQLQPQHVHGELVSPRLGIRFRTASYEEIAVFYPDGQPFLTFLQLGEARKEAEERATEAKQQAAEAKQQAAEEKKRATTAENRAEALAAKLRELGIDPDAI